MNVDIDTLIKKQERMYERLSNEECEIEILNRGPHNISGFILHSLYGFTGSYDEIIKTQNPEIDSSVETKLSFIDIDLKIRRRTSYQLDPDYFQFLQRMKL